MNSRAYLGALIFYAVCFIAHAESPVADSTAFGARDSRGAYQEVRIKPFEVTSDYFPKYVGISLLGDAADQAKNNIYPSRNPDMSGWGTSVQIVFQDGQLVSENRDTTKYRKFEDGKPTVRLYAVLAFDSKEQAATGAYRVDGVVTLVTGQFYSGPVIMDKDGNRLDPSFKQIAELGYKVSGAYYHDGKMGGQFNEFGNGKNDRGRISMVGLTSHDSEMDIALVRRAMGSYVEIVYP
jgi:hypothetical protein